ncbi:MAG: hypothetical protein ABIK09_12610 [Pseudomonadota bacterium]
MVRAFLAFFLLTANAAHADDATSVATQNNEAIRLSKEGDLDPAIGIWLTLLAETGTDYEFRWVFHKNIGRNFQKLGRLPEAWWHLTQAWELSGGGKSQKLLTWVGEVETAMGGSHTKVHLEGELDGTTVRFSTDRHGYAYRTPMEWWFLRGDHLVRVTAPNREAAARNFTVDEQTQTVTLSLPLPEGLGILVLRADPAAELLVDGVVQGVGDVEIETTAGPHVVESRVGGLQRWIGEVEVPSRGTLTKDVRAPVTAPPPPEPRVAPWTWALLAGGVAAVAGGGVTWWLAGENLDDQRGAYRGWLDDQYHLDGAVPMGKETEATKEWNSRVASKVTPVQISSYALWGVGGAAIAASAVLIGLDLARSGDADTTVQTVQPWALPGGAGLTTTFSF